MSGFGSGRLADFSVGIGVNSTTRAFVGFSASSNFSNPFSNFGKPSLPSNDSFVPKLTKITVGLSSSVSDTIRSKPLFGVFRSKPTRASPYTVSPLQPRLRNVMFLSAFAAISAASQ